eukprot:4542915-Ditylum_brightwellii.AAC.1
MVLGEEVTKVIFACCPVHQEMLLCAVVFDPIEAHIDCVCLVLGYCGVDNPTCFGVIRHDQGGWLGCLILVSASLRSLPFLMLEKRSPISALATDAITYCMILHTLCTGLLSGTLADGGLLGSADGSLRKKCPPALLHACGSDMNEASECMWRTMLLAW